MAMKLLKVSVVIIMAFIFLNAWSLRADVKEYEIPSFLDFTGPYADVTKLYLPVREAIINWWNDTEGKRLGIKITIKAYDSRYDPATVASLWPGIVSKNPIAALGQAGPDAVALQQRLPIDKVPVFYFTPSLPSGWLPNQWLFYPRPTYTHEYGGVLKWYIEQHPEKRPVKVAFLTPSTSPSHVDINNGVKKYIKEKLEPHGLATVAAEEFIEVLPLDLTNPVRKIAEKKVDLIITIPNTTIAAALLRAEQSLGVTIPTVASPFNTIWPLARAMKTYAPWEGHYVVGAHFLSLSETGKPYDFHLMLVKNYGLDQSLWHPLAELGYIQSLFFLTAVQHAAEKVGGANLTGEAMYNIMFEKPFTEEEMKGFLPTLKFTKEAPFPTEDLKIMIGTVKDGKYQLAAPGWLPAADAPK
jgi:branched-chain amino acid transport system substrate-binding protein